MNVPILSYLAHLIEEILTKDASSVGKAAGMAALAEAESDPKVEAITAASATLLQAAKNLKEVVNDHPDAPVIAEPPTTAA